MPRDFELYANTQEQQVEFHPNQVYIPTATYGMEQTFSAPYNPMGHMVDGTVAHELQYHYDAIAQGVKPYHYQTPAGSPHSTSHSFQEQPPILSASSESGASVSSSALGSPLHAAHFTERWSPIGLGLTSSFDFPAMVAVEKTFVGESMIRSSATFSNSISSPSLPFQNHTFKTPTAPASAKSSARRDSLLSHKFLARDIHTQSASTQSFPDPSKSLSSCRFLSA